MTFRLRSVFNASVTPGPPDAKQQGQELVSEGQVITAHSVVRHQEPARQSNVHPGLRVADCGVGCLHAERLHVFQQAVAQREA
jgi:hypothetical protein